MIAADIRMQGFVSASFSRLTALAAARDLGGDHEIQVLHSQGQVLAVVDTRTGRLPLPSGPSDPLDLARRLRAERGAARVVVAERGALRAAVAAAEAKVGPDTPQPVLMLLTQQAFRECPGVVCDPPLGPLDSWWALTRRLAATPDGAVVLAARAGGTDSTGSTGSTDSTEAWPIALAGRVAGGLLVELSDLAPEHAARLPEVPAGTTLALVTTVSELERALLAPDCAGALLDLLGPA